MDAPDRERGYVCQHCKGQSQGARLLRHARQCCPDCHAHEGMAVLYLEDGAEEPMAEQGKLL